jgi:hypothetical protein
MKSLFSSRTAAATLALLTALALSSCGSKQESASDTSATPGANTVATAQSNTATAPTSTPVAQTTQGVAAQAGDCPSANPIKGINSKKLGKIALTTKSPSYKTTKADKCFADAAAAQQAGYAVPK